MTPFYFGTRERRLFGVLHEGARTGRRSRAVLVCPPWGQEAIRAHRALRRFAKLAQADGHTVLRFDYWGTGDSAGDFAEAGPEDWIDDIETAIEETVDTTGVSRVTLVGLRLGATLAAAAAGRRRAQVDGLVLWDPVVSGRRYWEELAGTASGGDAESVEVLGFPITAAARRSLVALELADAIGGLPKRLLTVVSSGDAPAPADVEVERFDDVPAWLEERNLGAGAIPVRVIQRLVEWLR